MSQGRRPSKSAPLFQAAAAASRPRFSSNASPQPPTPQNSTATATARLTRAPTGTTRTDSQEQLVQKIVDFAEELATRTWELSLSLSEGSALKAKIVNGPDVPDFVKFERIRKIEKLKQDEWDEQHVKPSASKSLPASASDQSKPSTSIASSASHHSFATKKPPLSPSPKNARAASPVAHPTQTLPHSSGNLQQQQQLQQQPLKTSSSIAASRGSQKWAVKFHKSQDLMSSELSNSVESQLGSRVESTNILDQKGSKTGSKQFFSRHENLSQANVAAAASRRDLRSAKGSGDNKKQWATGVGSMSKVAFKTRSQTSAQKSAATEAKIRAAKKARRETARLLDMQEKLEREKELLTIYNLLESKRAQYHESVVAEILEKAEKSRTRREKLDQLHAVAEMQSSEAKRARREDAISRIRQRAEKYTLHKRNAAAAAAFVKKTNNEASATTITQAAPAVVVAPVPGPVPSSDNAASPTVSAIDKPPLTLFVKYPEDPTVPRPAPRRMSFVGAATAITAVITLSRKNSTVTRTTLRTPSLLEVNKSDGVGSGSSRRQSLSRGGQRSMLNVSGTAEEPSVGLNVVKPVNVSGNGADGASRSRRTSIAGRLEAATGDRVANGVAKKNRGITDTILSNLGSIKKSPLETELVPSPHPKRVHLKELAMLKPADVQSSRHSGVRPNGRLSVVLKAPPALPVLASLERSIKSLDTSTVFWDADLAPPVNVQWEKHHEKHATMAEAAFRRKQTTAKILRQSGTLFNVSHTHQVNYHQASTTDLGNTPSAATEGPQYTLASAAAPDRSKSYPPANPSSIPATSNSIFPIPPSQSHISTLEHQDASERKTHQSGRQKLSAIASNPHLIARTESAYLPTIRHAQSMGAVSPLPLKRHESSQDQTRPDTPTKQYNSNNEQKSGPGSAASLGLGTTGTGAAGGVSFASNLGLLDRMDSFANVADAAIDRRYEEPEVDLSKLRQTIVSASRRPSFLQSPVSLLSPAVPSSLPITKEIPNAGVGAGDVASGFESGLLDKPLGTPSADDALPRPVSASNKLVEEVKQIDRSLSPTTSLAPSQPSIENIDALVVPSHSSPAPSKILVPVENQATTQLPLAVNDGIQNNREIPEAAEEETPTKRTPRRRYIPLKMEDLFDPKAHCLIEPNQLSVNDDATEGNEVTVAPLIPHCLQGKLTTVTKWNNTLYY